MTEQLEALQAVRRERQYRGGGVLSAWHHKPVRQCRWRLPSGRRVPFAESPSRLEDAATRRRLWALTALSPHTPVPQQADGQLDLREQYLERVKDVVMLQLR